MCVSNEASRTFLFGLCFIGLTCPVSAWGQASDAGTQPPAEQGEVVELQDLPKLDGAEPADRAGAVTAAGISVDRLRWHVPDAEAFRVEALDRARAAEERLAAGTGDLHEAKADNVIYGNLAKHLEAISRPRKLELPLAEALHRALANSYAIRVESYYPAIRTAEVVEAEAAFDAAFFGNVSWNIQNPPTASALQGSQIDTFDSVGGVRQLLPTGMQVSTSLSLRRTSNNFQFQVLHPQYDSQYVVEFRQPLLRGFGLDFNRSQIRLAKIDRRLSDEAFARKVQDTLRDVESAYWRLFQARRVVAIQARSLARFEQIYERLEQRGKFDVIPIQINETKARLESARAGFIRICNEVRNTEDALISLVNDPAVDLADDIEIIPSDLPTLQPIVLDRLAEVQAALDHRQEISEARLRVKSAKILVGVAKNQVMPQVDLTFRYAVDGLGESADRAFDEVTKNDFHEYYVGVEFELPIGNRARRAALQKARLRHGQAIAGLKQAFEQVILDVNVRLRELLTQYALVGPNFESSQASEKQVESIRARAETQNYVQLSNELNAIQQLAANRADLIRSIVEYNIAIIQLERSKGTLLDYYNVVIPDAD